MIKNKLVPSKQLCFQSLILFIGLIVYKDALGQDSENAQQGPPVAMPVQVEEIQYKTMRLWNEFSGRMRAVDEVEIKPRVGGHIKEILFEDGDRVEKGDVLFIIDPRPYESEIARIKGQLQSASSSARLAKVELERIENLYKDKVVPKRDLDNAKNDHSVAISNIAVAKAELERAELNLEYAKITAPITGRISRAELTEGNLIETMMGAPVLTTIVATDFLYAEFDVDEQTYINVLQQSGIDKMMPVEMSLSANDTIVYTGHIHSFDNQLNISTGTIRARALFENTDGILVPGMFVNVRLGAAEEANEIILTERAIGTDQDKKYIYTLNQENQIQYQPVEIGRRILDKRIIKTTLEEGTRVVISNIQMIRPGMTVEPTVINDQ